MTATHPVPAFIPALEKARRERATGAAALSERASMGTWEVEGAQVRMRERERITSILLTDFATKTSYFQDIFGAYIYICDEATVRFAAPYWLRRRT